MNKRLISCMWPGLPERGWREKESEHNSRALQILKCRELYSELFTQTVLAFYQFRQDLCKWERKRWSRRFLLQLSENAFLLLHILVALLKVPAAHIYTTVTLRSPHHLPPVPTFCPRTPPPYLLWTLATVVEPEHRHTKICKRKQSFQHHGNVPQLEYIMFFKRVEK